MDGAATTPAQPTGWDGCGNTHYFELVVEEYDVDCTTHAERMDATQWVVQEHALVQTDRAASAQPTDGAPGQCRGILDVEDERRAVRGVANFDHACTVARPEVPVLLRQRMVSAAGRTGWHAAVTHSDRPTTVRYAPFVESEDFYSGDDVVMRFLDHRYCFARADFEQRVVHAAIELQLVDLPINRATRSDLVLAAISSAVEHPRSRVGERIVDLLERTGENPIYWLRKLVFRSAWIDHRIKHGLITVQFDDATGRFHIEPGRFPLPGTGHPSFAARTVPEDHA